MDAAFLSFETPSSHMHVAQTALFDPSTVPGGYSFERTKEMVLDRLLRLPAFRRRVVSVPFDLHHPIWVEDPHFDVDYHIRRIGAPPPGGLRELGELAGQIASIPLDRSRPLWELHVIEGLEDGNIGVVTKMHHCTVDGASGVELMATLFDLEPQGREMDPLEEVEPETVPSEVEMIGHALASRTRSTLRAVPLVGRTVRALGNVVSRHLDPGTRSGALPLTAPETPWNRAISARRTVAFGRVKLADVKAVKDHFSVTVNDIVLALMGATLRRYLEAAEALPEDPLVAVCPISVRTEEEKGQANNRVSAMFTSLATDIDDVPARIAKVHEMTVGAKEDHNAVGADMLTEWAELAAPRTFALASRMYSSMNLANRHRPIHNVVISNVPGPPMPLYFAGAELLAAYPMGPIMEGAGLNITVLSYRENVDIGFMACPDLVPDVWDLPGYVEEAMAELVEAAGLRGVADREDAEKASA